LAGGLINASWALEAGGRSLAVLQRLNRDIFDPVVHEDLEAVTRHLRRRGFASPVLLRTRQGALWHETPGGEAWRALEWIGDTTLVRPRCVADVRSAGELVAGFHRCTSDLRWDFRSVRGGFHDTALRMNQLREALAAYPTHRLFPQVRDLADQLLAAWSGWRGPVELPERIVHGDLKLSNVRFEGERAMALVDLDTLGYGTLDAELGDALRSWCNPEGESSEGAHCDAKLFAAAVEGYARGAEGGDLQPEEWESLVPGLERIALELAARFATDALVERYFGFDPAFGGRGEHNLLRARSQWRLAQSVRAQRRELEALVTRARPAGTTRPFGGVRAPMALLAPESAPPRHSSRELPAYRHVPGLTPHPLREPGGHQCSARRLSAEEALDHGRELFEARYWWEAHEAWERAWNVWGPETPRGRTVKAWILLAGALLVLHRGYWRGAHTLARKAVALLRSPDAETLAGVEPAPLASRIEAAVLPVRAQATLTFSLGA